MKFMSLAGNTWTANHCSDDTSLRFDGAVTGAVPSPALLRNYVNKRQPTQLCVCVCVCGEREREQERLAMRKEQLILFS
jgi:hypothetical protein